MSVVEAPALPVIDPGVEDDAAYLDQVEPGWYEKVDVNTLDLSSCTDCILGQVYGNYVDVCDRFLYRPGRRGGTFSHPRFETDWIAAILWRREANHG